MKVKSPPWKFRYVVNPLPRWLQQIHKQMWNQTLLKKKETRAKQAIGQPKRRSKIKLLITLKKLAEGGKMKASSSLQDFLLALTVLRYWGTYFIANWHIVSKNNFYIRDSEGSVKTVQVFFFFFHIQDNFSFFVLFKKAELHQIR